MATLTSSGTGRLTDDSGAEIPFQATVTVEVTDSLAVTITSVEIRPSSHEGISPDVLRHAAAGLVDFADYVAARAVRNQQVHAQTVAADHTWPAKGVILGPRFVDEMKVEVARRRRTHRTDDDYRRIAEVYRQAIASGDSGQKAVAQALSITQSHAGALIAETRRRKMLPPARRGRKQDL